MSNCPPQVLTPQRDPPLPLLCLTISSISLRHSPFPAPEVNRPAAESCCRILKPEQSSFRNRPCSTTESGFARSNLLLDIRESFLAYDSHFMKIARALTALTLAGWPLQAAVVTTADNSSPAGDGQTSFLEALTSLTDNETISFNIPGAGPHYLLTPAGGYPLIEKSGVTINGYSQPGASPNTAGLRQPGNASLRIVLDSRTDVEGQRRTVIDYPGFGTSESCILGLMDAVNARISGLAFIGVAGAGNDADPSVYNIALIKASTGVRVQGCWFGIDPGVRSWTPDPAGVVPGVYGARSAVASFKWSDGSSSEGLIFGTDGDGTGDPGEFNISVAQRLAVHLQTPNATVSGNWFNFFPDGSVLRPETQGLILEDGTLEAIENGDGTSMRIGTDGNGVSDANEGNLFGPVVYDIYVEFWRSAPKVIFAGNSVGVGLDGFPLFSSTAQGLMAVRKDSSMRIGSDMNGTGDAAEANHIGGLGHSFLSWHGNNNDAAGTPARISLRGNELLGNAGGIPLDPAAAVTPDRVYADVMQDPSNPTITLDSNSTITVLEGTAPVAAAGLPAPLIDVYLADASGLYLDPPAPQGRFLLTSFVLDGPLDLNAAAGAFRVNVAALGLTNAELGTITLTATYKTPSNETVTTSFSNTLTTLTPPPPLSSFLVSPLAAGVSLQWTGGMAPFRIQTSSSLAGVWNDLATTSAQSYTAAFDGSRRFYRVKEGASPR